jgi:uncharacterized delta-60 repeat protein
MKSWSSRTAKFLAAILVIAIVGPISQARATGTPITDPTYGAQGVATISIPKQASTSEVSDVLIDSSGNTIALVDINLWNGQQLTGEPKVAIARYLLDGSLDVDETFGDGSGTTTPLKLGGASITLQPDGKVLLVGLDYSQSKVALVARRYLTNGKLDTSFATKGMYSLLSLPNRYFNGRTLVAVDSVSGRIVLATGIDNGFGTSSNFYFVVLKRNGSEDFVLGFNYVGEIVLSESGSSFPELFSMEFLTGGGFLVLGKTPSSSGMKMVFLKFTPDGILDTTFGGVNNNDGIVTVSFAGHEYARMTAMDISPSGEIAVAGMVSAVYGEDWFYAMAMFDVNGLATGFHKTAVVATNQRDVSGLVKKESGRFYFPVYSDGKVALISVNAASTSSTVEIYAPAGRAISVALNDGLLVIGGSLDVSQPTSVVLREEEEGVSTSSNQYTELELRLEIIKLTPLSGGKILGLGSAISGDMGDESKMPLLFKLNSNGSIDQTFGVNGFVLVNNAEYSEISPSSLAVQEDGKIVVVAQAVDNERDVLLFRTTSTGVMDTAFGFVEYDSGASDSPASVLVDASQRILVLNNRYGNLSAAELVRFLPSGQVDSGFDGRTALTMVAASNGANRMKFDADQNIILVGGISDETRSPAFIARLSPTGQLDTTFSTDGFTLVDLNDDVTYPYSGLEDFVITDSGKIAAIGYGNTPHKREAIVFFDQSGNLDTSRANSSGMTRFETRADVDVTWVTSIVDDGDGFLVMGGGVVDGYSEQSSFATILRFGSNGMLDPSFDEDGVYLPDTNGAGFFTTVSRISTHQYLVGGSVLVDGFQRGLVMRIGESPTVVPDVVPQSPPPNVEPPQATVTQVAVSTTIPKVAIVDAQLVPLKLVISVSQATILKSMKLTVPKGGVATMSVAKSSAKVCKVVKKQVVGTAIGTCRVSVTIKMKKKKNLTKSMSFKVSG